ncbi:MAG: energy transducer TonB [Maricaulaceae bacterium]
MAIGIPLAAIITLTLFLIMRALIFTEEVLIEQRANAVQIEINPEIEEVTVEEREFEPEDVEVEPPPPPPEIRKEKAVQPTEGVASFDGALPDFEPPQLDSRSISFNVSDRDAQPLVRIEPSYPPRAAERGVEGECFVRFNVTAQGQPFDVEAYDCPSVFQRAAIRAVENWKYNPKIVDGNPVQRVGVHNQFVFRLADG